MKPKILAAIDGVHMGLGHVGLAALAKKFKVSLDKLEAQELVLFINRGRDKFKMMGSGGKVLGYVRMPSGRKFPLEAIQWLPQSFSGDGSIDIDTALKLHVEKVLEKKKTGGLKFYS